MPLAQVIPLEMNAPLAALRASIGRQDGAAFTPAFESLPASPFPNQVFAPAGR